MAGAANRHVGLLCGAVVLVVLTGIRIWDPAPLESLRLRTFDFLQTVKPRESTVRPVVIVDLDEESFKELGQWPWPRTLLADLITRLRDLGALTIGFDFVLPEPDRTSPALLADHLKGLDEAARSRLRELPSHDELFAEAIRPGRVVVGQSGFSLGRNTEAQVSSAAQTALAALGADPKPYLVNFPDLLRNVPAIEQVAAGRGLFSIKPERDGTVRRVPLVMVAEDVVVPSLTLETLRVATGSDAILTKADAAGMKSVGVAGVEIPTDPNGQLWLHFAPHDRKRYVSAAAVLGGRVAPDTLGGKLVLIGTSAVGLLDLKTTPVDAAMPGVEVHAQVLESILTSSVLSRPAYGTVLEIGAALFVGLLMIGVSPYLGAASLILIGAGAIAVLAGGAWYAFEASRLLLDVTFPLLSSFLVYLTVALFNYLKLHGERRRIRSAFQQYLSPALVDELANSPEKLVLGGEQRDLTVMFSDVRGFTAISELYKEDPQGLTRLMNRLLTPLTNAIIHQEGTIDKYMGDNIMAFWNAPLRVADHEQRACEAALQMLERLAILNDEREEEAQRTGTPFLPIKVGIGLNSGSCVVGNIGSDLHFNYSVLGDTVNLASRLEGQSKSYGIPILIGSRVAAAAQNHFAVLELDTLQVVGKNEPEIVHTILGRADVARSPAFHKLKDAHRGMLERYRAGEWDEALAAILECRSLGAAFGLEPLYTTYVDRIRKLSAETSVRWTGVRMAEGKG